MAFSRVALQLGACLLVLAGAGGPTLARANPSNGLPTEFRPSLPVFGPGALTNLGQGDNQALTNASAHVAWAVAVPLLAERLGGRKGLWIAGLGWIALTLLQEGLFHAPANPGPGYPAEVRTDLLTRAGPTALILVSDLLWGGRGGDAGRDARSR